MLFKHPAFKNCAIGKTPLSASFAASPVMAAYGPTPVGRQTTFNANSSNSSSTNASSLTMAHLNKLVKSIQGTTEQDKLFFTGEGLQVGAKFLAWITSLADEAVVFDCNLGPYFNLAPGTTDEEHDLTTKQESYDHFVFNYVTVSNRPYVSQSS